MDNNNRPHSRQKTVGNGSVNAGRGNKVNTGSRPVGFGGRTQGSSGGRDVSNGSQRALPSINLKTILVLGVLVIGALVLFKMCGGSLLSGDIGGDIGGDTNNVTSFSSAEVNSASYRTVDTTVSPLARKKYYTPAEGDSVTVMVYMCGTDLESKYGMATKDLNEMLAATYSDKVNVIVETGGCTKWQNNKVSNATNQIHRINKDGMTLLVDNFGTESMTEPTNLTKFINYCTTNYKADRNILVFWDHGGGSVTGYGYDEKNPNSPSMTLARINSALANAGCKFDFIGFDACLMATLETDLVCNNYADYLIGSEETEPGTGWYYTNWLTMLSENTATPTVYLAQRIIDDFVNSCCAARANAQVTLSVVDLSELDGTVPDALRDFAASTTRSSATTIIRRSPRHAAAPASSRRRASSIRPISSTLPSVSARPSRARLPRHCTAVSSTTRRRSPAATASASISRMRIRRPSRAPSLPSTRSARTTITANAWTNIPSASSPSPASNTADRSSLPLRRPLLPSEALI